MPIKKLFELGSKINIVGKSKIKDHRKIKTSSLSPFSDFISTNYSRSLHVDKKLKEILSNKEIIIKIFKNKDNFDLKKYIDPKNRFYIKNVFPYRVINNIAIGNSTLNAFIIGVRHQDSWQRYYVKYSSRNSTNINSINELIATSFLKNEGLNIIEPLLVYNSHGAEKHSFVVYPYHKLKTAYELHLENKISDNVYMKLYEFTNAFTRYFNNKYKLLLIDFDSKNIYYDLKSKRFFVSDVYIDTDYLQNGLVELIGSGTKLIHKYVS